MTFNSSGQTDLESEGTTQVPRPRQRVLSRRGRGSDKLLRLRRVYEPRKRATRVLAVICGVSHCCQCFRGAGHATWHGSSQRRNRQLSARFRRGAHCAVQRSPACRSTAAVARRDHARALRSGKLQQHYRRPDAVSFGRGLFPPASAGSARRRSPSIRRSRFRCRTPASRTPVTRFSCAWSTSTATVTAT